MILKNWVYCPSTVTIVVLAGLVGAIASGCTSFATPNVQQSKNSPSINTPTETVTANQGKNTPQSQEIQASTENSPNYWCIPPRREAGVCSANGWNPVR
jgi:hypothetical protein